MFPVTRESKKTHKVGRNIPLFSHLVPPLTKSGPSRFFFYIVFFSSSGKDTSQPVKGVPVAALTSPLTSSGLAWAHPVTFPHVDGVVRPEEGVIDLDWHKQPLPCLACHTASLGHCSMPECQMRKDGEHTGAATCWWRRSAATVLARAGDAPGQKKKKNLGLQGRAESAVRGESHTISIINKPMKFEKKENHTSFDIFPVVTHFYNKYTSQHVFVFSSSN